MKKIILLLTSLIVLTCAPYTANAEEPVYIYSTDILAFVNGEPIDSYNIGGKTVVIAEDLSDGYGYYHFYDDETRRLEIKSNAAMPYKEYADISRGKTGEILGEIYETDITVTFNSIPVIGYNIGGRTAICIEDIGEISDSPHAPYGFSKYLQNYVWNAEEKTISLNSYIGNINSILGANVMRASYTFADNVLYAYSDDESSYASIVPSVDGLPSEEGCTYYFSDDFAKQKYIISPLYLDTNGTRTEIGSCVTVYEGDTDAPRTFIHIDDTEAALELVKTVRTPMKTYEEAIEYLESTYTLIKKIENDKYTVLKLQNENGDNTFWAVKKIGGMLHMCTYPNDKTTDMYFEKDSDTELIVTVYPFTDPHGRTTTMNGIHDLTWYTFD